MRGMRVQRWDHRGLVARICREIGLAEYLSALAGLSATMRVGFFTETEEASRHASA